MSNDSPAFKDPKSTLGQAGFKAILPNIKRELFYPAVIMADPVPYVLISGSYKDNHDNDLLCKLLGAALSKLSVGIISGAGKAGLQVSRSLFERLIADKNYDPDRIICYLRKKEKVTRTEVETIGTVKFYGTHSLEMRKKMVFKSSAIIFIGGSDGTKQEEQLANIHNIPVIPIARSGGVAFDIWRINMNYPVASVQQFDKSTFEALNSVSINTAVEAAISLLKTSLPAEKA